MVLSDGKVNYFRFSLRISETILKTNMDVYLIKITIFVTSHKIKVVKCKNDL